MGFRHIYTCIIYIICGVTFAPGCGTFSDVNTSTAVLIRWWSVGCQRINAPSCLVLLYCRPSCIHRTCARYFICSPSHSHGKVHTACGGCGVLGCNLLLAVSTYRSIIDSRVLWKPGALNETANSLLRSLRRRACGLQPSAESILTVQTIPIWYTLLYAGYCFLLSPFFADRAVHRLVHRTHSSQQCRKKKRRWPKQQEASLIYRGRPFISETHTHGGGGGGIPVTAKKGTK